jgi:hypothetical protein
MDEEMIRETWRRGCCFICIYGGSFKMKIIYNCIDNLFPFNPLVLQFLDLRTGFFCELSKGVGKVYDSGSFSSYPSLFPPFILGISSVFSVGNNEMHLTTQK